MTNINTKLAVEFVAAIATHHKLVVNYDEVLVKYGASAEISLSELHRLAKQVGLNSKAIELRGAELKDLDPKHFPSLIVNEDGEVSLLLAKTSEGKLKLAIKKGEALEIYERDADIFNSQEKIFVILFGKLKTITRNGNFGFIWIINEALRHSSVFVQIAVISVILNFLAMGLPIYTQIVIDKVLSHNNMSTLIVVTVGVLVVMVFDMTFSVTRQLLMMMVTNKIDLKLSRTAFEQLLRLPIDYFEKRPVGLIARNIQQIHEVRNFLTSTLLFTLLDVFSVMLFLPVLFYYSVKLAAVLLLLSVLIGLNILIFLKPYNDRLEQVAFAESKKQGMLIESINGIRTIKSLALEFGQQLQWDDRVAKSINQSFALSKLGLVAISIVDLIQKNLTVIVVCLGSIDVINGQLSVGGLIAFMMLSGRVVGGLVQLASLVNAYQQASVAMDLIADVMNHPVESVNNAGARPTLKGGIEFDSVSFNYPGSSLTTLKDINFTIRPGELIGIVGKSGSGKSTISKLIQRLYHVKQGTIRFDGTDASDINLAYLRKNIGIVMQENFMFNSSVKENILISKPSIGMDAVINAAKISGAYEFIQHLEHGFDTVLDEGGGNISGGQRQRLGIARAIITDPKILILDEATSALDPDTEAHFMQNLAKISSNRTVLIISHRLSTLTKCDRIIVLDQGRIADFADHQTLLRTSEIYKNLWDQQNY